MRAICGPQQMDNTRDSIFHLIVNLLNNSVSTLKRDEVFHHEKKIIVFLSNTWSGRAVSRNKDFLKFHLITKVCLVLTSNCTE